MAAVQSSELSMPIKAVFFDFMGTCLDWHGAVTYAMPSSLPAEIRSPLALAWRQRYFVENNNRIAQSLPVEDVDHTFKRALFAVLSEDERFHNLVHHFDKPASSTSTIPAETRTDEAIRGWHRQRAWPEVPAALKAMRSRLGCEVYVHANGSTRLQIDNVRAAGLADGTFDLIMSSQLLGDYMPNLPAYERALELIKLKPQQVVKVAAHARDLRGAKLAGMKTVYIRRWTDDIDVDKEAASKEFDAVVDDMNGLPDVIDALQRKE